MFLEELEKISKIFKSIAKEKKLKVIHHLDADGVSSAAIVAKMLLRENLNFELKVVKQLTSKIIKKLDLTEKDILILLDLGSGQVDLLKDVFEKTQVLILDHHEPKKFNHLNLFHLNPLLFGEEEVSSSMVCYLFAKNLNLKNVDLIDLAIVGAVGDELDERREFKGRLCKKILEEAENIGKVNVVKGLRLYGRSRPIHVSLKNSFDPFIPGISGSESNAVQFLAELGIPVKENDEWKKLKDLDVKNQQKLASAIIIERLKAKHSNAADIFGNIYLLLGRPEEIQDAREFATLLNACGRLQRAEVGIRICLNDLTAIEESDEVLNEYRKLISECMEWLRENKEAILTKDSGNYILAKDKVPETLIGTITSIFLNSNLVDTSKPLFGLAYTDDGMIKISARVSKDIKINLRNVIVNAVERVGGEGGGHLFAAGGSIKKDKEKEFIKIVDEILGGSIGRKKS